MNATLAEESIEPGGLQRVFVDEVFEVDRQEVDHQRDWLVGGKPQSLEIQRARSPRYLEGVRHFGRCRHMFESQQAGGRRLPRLLEVVVEAAEPNRTPNPHWHD